MLLRANDDGLGSTPLDAFLAASRKRVDAVLDAALPAETEPPEELHRAMRYAVFSGGKRLRPALAFAGAVAAGADPQRAEPVAGAVELVHACSLVLDDLPALDDSNVRRGRPAVHVTFGEATAILAANALLSEAFAQCARLSDPAAAAAACASLARAVGPQAIIGGEVEDLAFASAGATVEGITSIHVRKTAALFRFAVWSGGFAGGLETGRRAHLDAFGHAYGLAFQIVDDLRDADLDECSILHALPPDEARERARNLLVRARSAIEPCGSDGWALAGLAGRLEKELS